MNHYNKLIKILKRNLSEVAVPKVADIVIDKLLEVYDYKLGGKVPLEDPTAPENIREDYIKSLRNSIESSLTITDDVITFGVGDRKDLGYDGVKDPLSTLVFALEGFLDEYAFIPAPIINQRFKKSNKLGRYGDGYLVSKKSFEKNKWDNYVSWEEVKLKYAPNESIDIFDVDVSEEVDNIFTNTIKTSITEFIAQLKVS